MFSTQKSARILHTPTPRCCWQSSPPQKSTHSPLTPTPHLGQTAPPPPTTRSGRLSSIMSPFFFQPIQKMRRKIFCLWNTYKTEYTWVYIKNSKFRYLCDQLKRKHCIFIEVKNAQTPRTWRLLWTPEQLGLKYYKWKYKYKYKYKC